MSISVDVVRSSSTKLLDGINKLLPQLSGTARPLTSLDLDAMIESDSVSLLVAFDGDDVVGMLTLVIFPIPTGVRAWIEDVVVDEKCRGAGIGEALSVRAVDLARMGGAKTIELTSRPSREAANHLYSKLGFGVRETNVYRFFIENEP
jgi:ribosomal protein S18 acetylase RimI-like enzyme